MRSIAIDVRKIHHLGIGDYIQQLLRGISGSGFQGRVYLLFSLDTPQEFLPKYKRFHYIPVQAKGYSLREHWEIPWKLSPLSVDIYHVPHYVLPLFYRRKMVVTIHDVIHLRFPEYRKKRASFTYAKWMIRYAANMAEKVITDSEYSKRDIVSTCGIPGEKIEVVPLGINPNFYRDIPKQEIRKTLSSYSLFEPYIFYSGNHKKHKNLHFLMEIFREIESRHPHHLVITGPPDSNDKTLRKKFADLEGKVHWLGRVPHEHLPCLLKGADVFIYPSLYEGFGYPPLEASAAGVPVICSNRTSLPEVMGKGACLIPPENPVKWADVASKIITDESFRQEQIKCGIENAQKYSWKQTAEKTLLVYEQVLDRKK